jgi:cobyrinic acid a,c-diamide synthase
MAQIFISAAHKSSGKTTVAVGLCAVLRARGFRVQPFKKGPDFIDPLWLSEAAGRPCRNLDHHTMSETEIVSFAARHATGIDVAVIEGNKGLYDGVATDGRGSSAALARLLRAPVVLVIDTEGMTRGIAPLLLGYRSFEPELAIAGVILNKVSGPRHEAKLRSAVAAYTDLPVLGSIQRSPALVIPQRHLGLLPANEAGEVEATINLLAAAVGSQVDIDQLLACAQSAPHWHLRPAPGPPAPAPGRRRRLGLAQDAAFGFYYADDIEALARADLEVIAIDTLRDPHLPPDLDGLFLGGGFPETQMQALEANVSLRRDIFDAVTAGLPTYAECGGMMYLSRSIAWQGQRCAMVGALDADAVMHPRPQGKGYVLLRQTAQHPWPPNGDAATLIAAHEFHHASLENLGAATRFAYEVVRGQGIGSARDGIVFANTLASFSHLRGVGADPWPGRFAGFVHQCADRRLGADSGRAKGNDGAGDIARRRPRAQGSDCLLRQPLKETYPDVKAHHHRRPQGLLSRTDDGVDRRIKANRDRRRSRSPIAGQRFGQ